MPTVSSIKMISARWVCICIVWASKKMDKSCPQWKLHLFRSCWNRLPSRGPQMQKDSPKRVLETRSHVFYPRKSFWGLSGVVRHLLFFSKSCLVESNVNKTAVWPSFTRQLIPQIMSLLWTSQTKDGSVLIGLNQAPGIPTTPNGINTSNESWEAETWWNQTKWCLWNYFIGFNM